MEKNNDKSKSNDPKEIVFSTDRSSSAKESGNGAGPQDFLSIKDDLPSIFGSELNSELSETDKLSIVESLSSDDENSVKLNGKPPPVKVGGKGTKERVVPTPKAKQPQQKKQSKADNLALQYGSQSEDSDDDQKYILGDYAEGHRINLPDTVKTEKPKMTSTKLEQAKTIADEPPDKKVEKGGPIFEKTQTAAAAVAKVNSFQPLKETDSKSPAKPKTASPAPFVHPQQQQHKQAPPPNSAKTTGFERTKAVDPKTKSEKSTKKSTASSSGRRTASPHSPASIMAKCACKKLAPGKVNNPIGEAEGSKIFARPKMVNLDYDPSKCLPCQQVYVLLTQMLPLWQCFKLKSSKAKLLL